ncbi:MAG: bshC [Chitinophagaceae bacterium]|nr:bshC [Chitinophagaceae bacterium]
MDTHCSYISYKDTGYFAKIVTDYLERSVELQPFYQYPATKEGLLSSIKQRSKFSTNRVALTDVLKEQYVKMDLSIAVMNNIDALAKESTFTITTAHQPNVFTGPLYFIYKIAHAIKLAVYCKQQFPEYDFVPVYYMGSEDADLEELGNISIDGEDYKWNTSQTGAVGRMKIDRGFIELINKIEGQIGIHPHGAAIASLFRKFYTLNKSIQQATLEIVNALFGEYGLVTIIPDHHELKKQFIAVAEKELKEEFSHDIVEKTTQLLSQSYKVQAAGREINLFYLTNDKRERIEKRNGRFYVINTDIAFSETEILNELQIYPERFSPNVILRGIFQELILPNIIFIGGGSELAYWLELKTVFEKVNIPYPVLILRNSFLLLKQEWEASWEKLGFAIPDIFKDELELMKQLVQNSSQNKLHLNGELTSVEQLYEVIKAMAGKVDASLAEHVEALRKQSVKRLRELEKKMLRSEKKKFDAEQRQLQKIKSLLFPNGLQERAENFSGWYARDGKGFIDAIINNSLATEQQFTILHIKD